MNVPLSTDRDYNLWVLLHQAKDAVFKAREKELSQYGITAMEAGALFIIQSIGNKATPAEIHSGFSESIIQLRLCWFGM